MTMSAFSGFLSQIQEAFFVPGSIPPTSTIKMVGRGNLSSWFEVTPLAAASMVAAGQQIAEMAKEADNITTNVTVNRRLASLWYGWTLDPQGWSVPSPWDEISGDYPTSDGWIRLHTNVLPHRNAVVDVLKQNVLKQNTHEQKELRQSVALAVKQWQKNDLEQAVVNAGGCAAAMRSLQEWHTHPQGRHVIQEPLVAWGSIEETTKRPSKHDQKSPLSGVRVLDLTRILAGPVAGRFLAGYGADVLRIDPPDWNEPGVIPEVTLGKRCAALDLHKLEDRQCFETLLAQADVILHGYRPQALAKLGYDAETLRKINPSLIDVTLNAYGWTGPWANRRGFDSLVQMSSGIADYGMARSGRGQPTPLPVQALDHSTGYLMAAAVIHAIRRRSSEGKVLSAKLSLARVSHLLALTKRMNVAKEMAEIKADDFNPPIENTAWGPARRVRFPLHIEGTPACWPNGATELRSSTAQWRE